MTVLRAAPREVYRVYDEDEFWAHTEQELFAAGAQRVHAGATAGRDGQRRSSRRTLPRVVGPGALMAVVGVVGGLVALTVTSSVSRGRHRSGVRLLADAALRGPSQTPRAHVWHEAMRFAASAPVRRLEVWRNPQSPAGRELPAMRDSHSDARSSAGPQPRAAVAPPTAAPAEDVAAEDVAADGVAAPATAPVAAEERPATVSTSAPRSPSGQSEFGFER